MDCTKTAGPILESSERQCRISSVSLLRFWYMALIVILIILREKIILGALNLVTILIRMRK